MTLAMLALAITLTVTDVKGHPVTVGFPPLKVRANVHTIIPHVRKGVICIVSANQGESCRTLEDVEKPTLQRPYTIRESDVFMAVIEFEGDDGKYYRAESNAVNVNIAGESDDPR